MRTDARTLAALTPLLGPCLAAGLGAQPAETFVDTVEINVVEVDVVVTDRKGRPVNGLKPEDFELSVDGMPVEIANFFESKVFSERTALGADARKSPADESPGAPGRSPAERDDSGCGVPSLARTARSQPAGRTSDRELPPIHGDYDGSCGW